MLAGGEVLEADIVISNVDLPTTYSHLLHTSSVPRERAGGQDAERLASLDYSSVRAARALSPPLVLSGHAASLTPY